MRPGFPGSGDRKGERPHQTGTGYQALERCRAACDSTAPGLLSFGISCQPCSTRRAAWIGRIRRFRFQPVRRKGRCAVLSDGSPLWRFSPGRRTVLARSVLVVCSGGCRETVRPQPGTADRKSRSFGMALAGARSYPLSPLRPAWFRPDPRTDIQTFRRESPPRVWRGLGNGRQWVPKFSPNRAEEALNRVRGGDPYDTDSLPVVVSWFRCSSSTDDGTVAAGVAVGFDPMPSPVQRRRVGRMYLLDTVGCGSFVLNAYRFAGRVSAGQTWLCRGPCSSLTVSRNTAPRVVRNQVRNESSTILR